jgi:hypothetical protein
MPNDDGAEDRRPATRRDGEVVREPDNSTVHDWLGQRVARDEALAERTLAETAGDEVEAERRFDRRSDEGDEYRRQHTQEADGMRPKG